MSDAPLTAPEFERRLSELALRSQYLTRSQLDACLSERQESDPSAPLEVFLVSMGFLTEDEAEELAGQVRENPAGGFPEPAAAAPAEPPAPAPPPPPAPVAPESPPETPLAIYGSCTILEPMARGPSGTVYRAFDGDLEREVALKLVPVNPLNQPFIRIFGLRARAQLDLAHPGIAKMHDLGLRREALYIASEMIDGPTLFERIKRDGGLELEEACSILRSIAEALQEAHRRRVTHGNLKPENVFLTGGGVKLTDFGLGRDDGEFLKKHADLAGSIIYSLAPEQWRGDPAPASDLYACGVLWHFMLTGEYAFAARHTMDIRKNHLQGKAKPPSAYREGLPPAVDALFRTLTAKEMGKRLRGADQLAEEVDLLARGKAPAAAAAAATRIAAKKRSRSRVSRVRPARKGRPF